MKHGGLFGTNWAVFRKILVKNPGFFGYKLVFFVVKTRGGGVGINGFFLVKPLGAFLVQIGVFFCGKNTGFFGTNWVVFSKNTGGGVWYNLGGFGITFNPL